MPHFRCGVGLRAVESCHGIYVQCPLAENIHHLAEMDVLSGFRCAYGAYWKRVNYGSISREAARPAVNGQGRGVCELSIVPHTFLGAQHIYPHLRVCVLIVYIGIRIPVHFNTGNILRCWSVFHHRKEGKERSISYSQTTLTPGNVCSKCACHRRCWG